MRKNIFRQSSNITLVRKNIGLDWIRANMSAMWRILISLRKKMKTICKESIAEISGCMHKDFLNVGIHFSIKSIHPDRHAEHEAEKRPPTPSVFL